MKRKICSLFLVFVMILGLLPTAVFAAEADSITAYVTISDTGALVAGTDGTTVAYAPVTVTDQNQSGTFDIDDALHAAHEQYYGGGAEEGYASADSDWGLSVTKLWGDTSYNFGYLVNNGYATGLTQVIAPGAHVVRISTGTPPITATNTAISISPMPRFLRAAI